MDDGDELDGTSFAQSGGKKRARKPTNKAAQNEKPAKKAKLTILEKQPMCKSAKYRSGTGCKG